MHLLIALGLWVAASIPLALVLGRAMRASGRSGGLIEEIEGYLRRQAPGARSLRHAGGLVFAATLVAALALLGNEAVQQLPAAQVVADRLLAKVTTTTTVAPPATEPSPATSVPAARHTRRRPPARATEPMPPSADTAFPTFDQPSHEEGTDRPAGVAVDQDEDEGPTTTTTSTTVPDDADEHRVERDRKGGDDDRGGPDDRHHGKDDDQDRARDRRPTTTTTSTSTTSTTTPAPPTTTEGSTPAGSTTTAPSTTTTTEPDEG